MKTYTALTEAETRELLADPEREQAFLESYEKWTIASDWIADLLDMREEEDGYQYNSSFQKWLEAKEGWTPEPENGSALSLLVYTSQTYRRQRSMRRAGYRLLDNAVIQEALTVKKRVEIKVFGVLGASVFLCRPVALGDGRFAAMKPRSRTRGFLPGSDTWAKVAA